MADNLQHSSADAAQASLSAPMRKKTTALSDEDYQKGRQLLATHDEQYRMLVDLGEKVYQQAEHLEAIIDTLLMLLNRGLRLRRFGVHEFHAGNWEGLVGGLTCDSHPAEVRATFTKLQDHIYLDFAKPVHRVYSDLCDAMAVWEETSQQYRMPKYDQDDNMFTKVLKWGILKDELSEAKGKMEFGFKTFLGGCRGVDSFVSEIDRLQGVYGGAKDLKEAYTAIDDPNGRVAFIKNLIDVAFSVDDIGTVVEEVY